MRRDRKSAVWWTLLFGILSVLLLTGCGARNGSQMELGISEEDLTNAMDICTYEKTYYVAAADKILLYDAQGNPGKVYSFPERVIAQVAYGDALYALDAQNQSVLKLDKDGKIEGECKLDFEMEALIDFEAAGSNVYLSVEKHEGDEHVERTYVLPWKEQQAREMLEKGVVMAVKGNLITYHQGRLVGYDMAARTEKEGEEYGSIGMGFGRVLTSFCVDSNNKYYYCIDQKVVKEEEGEMEYLHHMDTDYDVVATCGDTVLLLQRFERLTLVTKAPYVKEYEQSLALYGAGTEFDMPDGTHRSLKEEFEAEFDAAIECTSDLGMNQETFLTNLMSGSDKYDIYRFNGMLTNSFDYVRNHAYVDLSENREIVEKLNQWYDSIVEGCKYNGELFAVPGGCNINVLYYNKALYPELMDEDISTWDAFLDTIEKYDKKVGFNKIRLESVLLEQYVATYCDTQNGEYQFDTEAFRKVLRLLKRIDQMDILYYQDEGFPEMFENGEIFAFGSMESYLEQGFEFVPLPSINSETSVSAVHLGYNVINPNSGQKELAMEYMSLLAECGTYSMKDSAGQYPLIADIFENHAKCIFGDYVDYGNALEKYIVGNMTEDEAIEEITELTQRKLNQ